MQASGGHDEPQAVQEGALTGGQLVAVRIAVEDGEKADQHSGGTSGGRHAVITAAPSASADRAMPISVPGSGMPRSPSTPPSAITIGNATGNTQIAGGPSCAPQVLPQSSRPRGRDRKSDAENR